MRRVFAGRALLLPLDARHLRIALALALAAAAPVRASADDVRIGVEAPLSGADAVFGNQLRLGVAQAIADANADGGFLGAQATMETGDDGGDPKRGIEVAKGFVAAKVPFVIGPFSSAVTIPASAVYAEARTPEITPSATAPLVTERGLATVFRMGGREDQQAAVAARYLARHFARVAIVHDRTGTGKGLADAVRKALADAGQREVFYGSLEKGTRDYPGLVARLKASGAQAVFWGGNQVEAGLLARQLRDAGARITMMGGLGLASDEFASLAGPAADGSLLVFPRDPRTRPAAAALLRRLHAKDPAKDDEPDGYTFYAYAAVQVIQQAAQAAGSLDPVALAATMHSGKVFKTVLGDIAFDTKGDPKATDLTVYVWHKGAGGRMAFDQEAAS